MWNGVNFKESELQFNADLTVVRLKVTQESNLHPRMFESAHVIRRHERKHKTKNKKSFL